MKPQKPPPNEQAREEQRRALRDLLMRPLLTPTGPHAEAFHRVRRHADPLRQWLARNLDWSLTVEAEVIRLRKVPGCLADDSRGAADEGSALPFTRRRYVLFCLALAALERSERQTALGKLAEDIAKLHRDEPAFAEQGVEWGLLSQDGRRDLVHAVRLLLSLGVLTRMHGDELQFVQSEGDVLYRVNGPVLSQVLATRHPPSMIHATTLDDRARLLVEEPELDSEDARNRRIRVSLTRRLVEDPVLYFEDLSEEERAYLTSQRAHLVKQVEEGLGLVAELRREGLAMVDEGGRLTDIGIPEEGTEGHLALLLAEFLVKHARQAPGAVVPRSAIVAHVARLVAQYGEHWRKDARAPGAEESLADEALFRLQVLDLVRRTPEGVVPKPAIGRYALGPPKRARPTTPSPT